MNKNVKLIIVVSLLNISCFCTNEVSGYVMEHQGSSLLCTNNVKASGYPASAIKRQSDALNCIVFEEKNSGSFENEEKMKLLITQKAGYAFFKSICSIDGIYELSDGRYIQVDSTFSLNACVGTKKSKDTVYLPIMDISDYAGQQLFVILNIDHTGALGTMKEKVAIPFTLK